MTSIVGVCLLRNEEYFATWALMNVMEFCDHILVMDNYSTDDTAEILQQIATQHSHVEIIKVRDPNDTHDLLQSYFDTDTWMLKVDGDEIYDPQGLTKFRKDLLNGKAEYAMQRGIGSVMAHVANINFDVGSFAGYLVLEGERPQGGFVLNCNAVKSWSGKSERLHAENPVWHPEYARNLWHVNKDQIWEAADFRCLHMCFWPRSSSDQNFDEGWKFMSRWNPREAPRQETGFRKIRRKIFPRYYTKRVDHKNRWYRNNTLQVFYDLEKFGRPDAYPLLNPKSNEVIDRMKSISIDRAVALRDDLHKVTDTVN